MEILATLLASNPIMSGLIFQFRAMATLIQLGRASLTITPHADGVQCLLVVDKSLAYEAIAPSLVEAAGQLASKFQLNDTRPLAMVG